MKIPEAIAREASEITSGRRRTPEWKGEASFAD